VSIALHVKQGVTVMVTVLVMVKAAAAAVVER